MDRRVSVIVTCHNQAHWVAQALDSVAAQTESDVQIVVTDDGSTDSSRDVIARWASQHTLDVTVTAADRNVGLPAMLNRATRCLTGRYVVVLNADDWMDPHRLSAQAHALDEAGPGVGLVYSDLRVVDVNGTPTGGISPPLTTERREGDVLAHIIARPMIGMPGVMVRHSVLDRVGPWDESLPADDFDFLLRVAAAGYRFRYLPGVVGSYRAHAGSLTGTRGGELAEGRIRALRKLLGRDANTDRAVYARIRGLAVALHVDRYDRATTRRELRSAFVQQPSRRVARALVENWLRLPPGVLSPAVHGIGRRGTRASY